jgi:hypothetical protein
MRGKKNLASGTVCGTVQRESTQSVYHFWTLCDWSEKRCVDWSIFSSSVLGSHYKNCIFCNG